MAFGLSKNKSTQESAKINSAREQQALKEFKQLLADLIELLRKSTDMDTVYMFWVNHARQQFVRESSSSRFDNVIFKDRVEFENHFLDHYKDITEPVLLQIGDHLPARALNHYYHEVPVRFLTLIPFINNGQTIAITVLESKFKNRTEEEERALRIYQRALNRLLNTYLEVNDLSENQHEWEQYEMSLERVEEKTQPVEILHQMLIELDALLPRGGAFLVSRGMNSWCNVLNIGEDHKMPALGTLMNERSLCYLALKNGEPEFAMHFNNSPKRLGLREQKCEGATFAIPVLLNDRRQAVVVAYDENPLVFNEALKHKINNFVRIVSLKLMAHKSVLNSDEDLLTNEYDAFISELWETVINEELYNLPREKKRNTWFGFITLDNLSTIRTRHRLDDLKILQKKLIQKLNPSNYGLSGFIGAKTDYVYSFILQSKEDTGIQRWKEALQSPEAGKVHFGEGKSEQLHYKMGYTLLEEKYKDFHEVIKVANTAFNEAVRRSNAHVIAG